MKLRAYIEKHPRKKSGPPCKVCILPKRMRAEVDAALAIGDEVMQVWQWLRFDQRKSLSRSSLTRHKLRCLKIRRRHGTA